MLSLVSLFLDLGRYVVLEDGVSRGKWSDWCDPSVVFILAPISTALNWAVIFFTTLSENDINRRLFTYGIVKIFISSSAVRAWNLYRGIIVTAWVIEYSPVFLEPKEMRLLSQENWITPFAQPDLPIQLRSRISLLREAVLT